jgi:riboflavin synthase
MTGHVDGVGTVVAFEQVEEVASGTGSYRLDVDVPPALARFIAAKGSIAVQGVSLTVNGVDGARFHVNLIPHTLGVTTLKALQRGARVNLEVDLVARYVARLSEA